MDFSKPDPASDGQQQGPGRAERGHGHGAAAREAASDARSLVKLGSDPINARNAERARKRLEDAKGTTFDEAAEQRYVEEIAAHLNATTPAITVV